MDKVDRSRVGRRCALMCAVGIAMLLIGGADAATPISTCITISSSGEYVLNRSIINSGAGTCIRITSSDVIFDGAGYTISGRYVLNTRGVNVNNSSMTLTNVTVKNLKVTNWY